MKKKIIMLLSTAIIFSLFTGCSSSQPANESSEVSVISSVPELIPESSVSPSVSVYENPDAISDEDRDQLSELINGLIDESYKTPFYSCDILTPINGSGGMVSVQIESDSFSVEENCISAVTGIISGALSSPLYSSIHSFDINFLCDGQLKYMISVEDASSISSSDEIADSLDILPL